MTAQFFKVAPDLQLRRGAITQGGGWYNWYPGVLWSEWNTNYNPTPEALLYIDANLSDEEQLRIALAAQTLHAQVVSDPLRRCKPLVQAIKLHSGRKITGPGSRPRRKVSDNTTK